MDHRERLNPTEESIRVAFEGFMASMWTAMPGIIVDFDATKQTASVQLAIQGKLRDADGTEKNVSITILPDVPVHFTGGGGFTLTFPIAPGDECLVVFSNRCIDAWWQNGDVQPQAEERMYDLSDGFAIVGFRSIPRALSGISTTAAQLRSDDGTVFVEATADTVHVSAPHVKVHGGTSYQWDVQGYGQKITWTGGSNYTVDNYTIGAVVTTVNHAINPPEIP